MTREPLVSYSPDFLLFAGPARLPLFAPRDRAATGGEAPGRGAPTTSGPPGPRPPTPHGPGPRPGPGQGELTQQKDFWLFSEPG